MSDDRTLEAELSRAWPLGGGYVTQNQLTSMVSSIETKIQNSELRQRNWVLAGCIAIILTFGGGYMSLVAKLDNLSQSMPAMEVSMEGRRGWMMRKDQQDSRRDESLLKLDKTYQPMPYQETPK